MTRVDVLAIIQEMHNGKGVKKCLEERGLHPQAFYNFLYADPSIEELYTRAQKARAEMLVDEIIEISDTEQDANRARVRTDARKWYASKMQPQKFGDRIDVNVNQTVDFSAAIAEAKRRALPMRDQRNIEDADIIETKALPLSRSTGSKSVDAANAQGKDADADPSANFLD